VIIYTQMLDHPQSKSKFEQLYLQYRNWMYSIAYQLLQNNQDAEDAVHQAFLSVLKNISKISEIDCPKTRGYLVIIVERKSIDILRDRKKLAEQTLDETIHGISYPLPGDHGIQDAIARLPARYREVLLLRYAQGYETREVAELLDLSYETCRKLLYRAKNALKQQLEKDGETP